MTFLDQTAVIAFAAESGLLQPGDIQQWALNATGLFEEPPFWLIELAMWPEKPADLIHILREHCDPPSTRVCLQILIAGHSMGLLSLHRTLPMLFQAEMLDRDSSPHEPRDEMLEDALVEWDCQENLDVIPAALEAKFHVIFQDYLSDAGEILSLLSPGSAG